MEFGDFDVLTDGEIDLILKEKYDGDFAKGFLPEYKFLIILHGTKTIIGHIHLRIGDTEKTTKYIGHIGYGIDEQYRGHRFAAKACIILKRVLQWHSINKVILTCNPDNGASRRTCELIGAQLIEIIDIPPESDAYLPNETQKCRYEWAL